MNKAVLKLLVTGLLCLSVVFIQNRTTASDIPQPQDDFEQQDYHNKPSGQIKKVRKPQSAQEDIYKVRKGDTLYGIAREHGVRPDELAKINKISADERLFAGMKLRIPSSKKGATECFAPASDENEKQLYSTGGFQWPVNPVIGVGRDGEKGVRTIGVIIKSRPGTKVCSAASGMIEKVGRMRGFGNFVVMRHPDGLMTVYSGLGTISVREGIRIKKGSSLGELADNSAELHFMVHRKGRPEDPLKHLPSKKG